MDYVQGRSRGTYFTVTPHHLHTELLQCIVGFQERTMILDLIAQGHRSSEMTGPV